jgi:hypothetical protein
VRRIIRGMRTESSSGIGLLGVETTVSGTPHNGRVRGPFVAGAISMSVQETPLSPCPEQNSTTEGPGPQRPRGETP